MVLLFGTSVAHLPPGPGQPASINSRQYPGLIALVHALHVLQPTMPRAIISPSVLASDFGQLTAECTRMIKGGAEWLHMGELCLVFISPLIISLRLCPLDVMDGYTFLSYTSAVYDADTRINAQSFCAKYHDG